MHHLSPTLSSFIMVDMALSGTPLCEPSATQPAWHPFTSSVQRCAPDTCSRYRISSLPSQESYVQSLCYQWLCLSKSNAQMHMWTPVWVFSLFCLFVCCSQHFKNYFAWTRAMQRCACEHLFLCLAFLLVCLLDCWFISLFVNFFFF